jgi:aarF domain-containing kinase
LQVTPEQSLALVEYIAHLSVEDWNGIARDLRKLGFVPAGMQPAIILVSCHKKKQGQK